MLGVRDREAHVGATEGAQSPQRRGLVRACSHHRRVQFAEDVNDDSVEEVGLVGEVQVDRRRGDADGFGYGADRDVVHTAGLRHQLLGRGDDLGTQLLAATARGAATASGLAGRTA